MTKQQKITLSASRDIPFNKLMLSQSNVRHVKAGVSIEELAEDIARRTLLSSITVRPVLDESGTETGMYTIPAGGRRFRALELLVKQKRMNKTALVPCIVRTDGLAEEDSLAENVQRAPLHPLDQFRAFQAMREKGRTEEEIAAAFFVSASVVKQRLKLAAVAPSLHDAYAEEEMTLDQLMAFTVNPDQRRLQILQSDPDTNALAAIVPLDQDGFARLDAIYRLLAQLHGRKVPVDKRLTRQKRLRAKRMLQAYDGRLAGASQREIAEVVLRLSRVSRDEWQYAPERFAVMALLRDAQKMVDGGYHTLLRPIARR